MLALLFLNISLLAPPQLAKANECAKLKLQQHISTAASDREIENCILEEKQSPELFLELKILDQLEDEVSQLSYNENLSLRDRMFFQQSLQQEPEQKKKFLLALARGDKSITASLSENTLRTFRERTLLALAALNSK